MYRRAAVVGCGSGHACAAPLLRTHRERQALLRVWHRGIETDPRLVHNNDGGPDAVRDCYRCPGG